MMFSRTFKIIFEIASVTRKTFCTKSSSSHKRTISPNVNYFANKSVLITGGASGIGLQCAKSLLKEGAKGVTIADHDNHAGECALKEICQEFGNNKAIYVKCDVMKSELVDWAFRNAVRAFKTVDIVVNSAGILNDKKWELELATNIGGCLVGNLLALQYMSTTCHGLGGIVVNISSTLGLEPLSGCPLFSMTQTGIIGLTRALGCGSHRKRTNVSIMGLCVGFTDTKLLAQATNNTLNENFGIELKTQLQEEVMQDPIAVADALIAILKINESGSIWVVDKAQPPYKLKFPKLDDMKCETPKSRLDGNKNETECEEALQEKIKH